MSLAVTISSFFEDFEPSVIRRFFYMEFCVVLMLKGKPCTELALELIQYKKFLSAGYLGLRLYFIYEIRSTLVVEP